MAAKCASVLKGRKGTLHGSTVQCCPHRGRRDSARQPCMVQTSKGKSVQSSKLWCCPERRKRERHILTCNCESHLVMMHFVRIEQTTTYIYILHIYILHTYILHILSRRLHEIFACSSKCAEERCSRTTIFMASCRLASEIESACMLMI